MTIPRDADPSQWRGWINSLMQSIATAAIVFVPIFAWGNHIEGQITSVLTQYASINARVSADEANAMASSRAMLELSDKLDGLSTQLATITAELSDLRTELKK
jgi:hypothetical protein